MTGTCMSSLILDPDNLLSADALSSPDIKTRLEARALALLPLSLQIALPCGTLCSRSGTLPRRLSECVPARQRAAVRRTVLPHAWLGLLCHTPFRLCRVA